MKTFLKVNAVIAGVSLIGMVVFGIIARDDIANQLKYEPFVSEYDPAEAKAITINAENRSIVIGPSTTGKINLSFYISDIDTYTLDTNDNNIGLDIKTPLFQNIFATTSIFNLISNSETSTIKINVPDVMFDNVNVVTKNGRIEIKDLTANVLYAQTYNGTIVVENTTTSNTTINSSNGSILIKQFNSTSLNVKSSNSEIKGEHVTSTFLTAKTSNGQIKFEDVTSNDLYANTSNGNIILRVNGAFVDFKTAVNTKNGTIKIDETKFSNGTYHEEQEKKLTAITSNGLIRINFI